MTTITPSKPSLTTNDSAVLQALFDAESSPSPSSSHVQTDASLPPLPNVPISLLPSLQARELAAIKPLNPRTPENENENSIGRPDIKDIKSAIQELSALISETPAFASAYVNRAQAYRLLIDSSTSPSTSTPSSSEQEPAEAATHCTSLLLDDLARAIALLTPAHPTAAVSPLTARILANAHTHRAYLLYRASRAKQAVSDSDPDAQQTSLSVSILPSHLRSLSSDALEEMASYDFALGGRYGNPVAKELAVRTNPYAKMCGAIVRDAMRAEIEEWVGGNNK